MWWDYECFWQFLFILQQFHPQNSTVPYMIETSSPWQKSWKVPSLTKMSRDILFFCSNSKKGVLEELLYTFWVCQLPLQYFTDLKFERMIIFTPIIVTEGKSQHWIRQKILSFKQHQGQIVNIRVYTSCLSKVLADFVVTCLIDDVKDKINPNQFRGTWEPGLRTSISLDDISTLASPTSLKLSIILGTMY